MPVPEELLPRAPKKEESSKKPLDETRGKEGYFEVGKRQPSTLNNQLSTIQTSTSQQLTNNKPSSTINKQPQIVKSETQKAGFNWAWFSRRILPIFLFVLLAAGISIAAIPSWRNAFNNFIAKWSPKADVLDSCMISEPPEEFNDENLIKYFPLYINQAGGTNKVPANMIVLGEDITISVDNKFAQGCWEITPDCSSTGNYSPGCRGVARITIRNLPKFNYQGWPYDGDRIVLPEASSKYPDAIINPSVKKVVESIESFGAITPNGNAVILTENGEAFDINYFKWANTNPLPEWGYNQKFNSVSWHSMNLDQIVDGATRHDCSWTKDQSSSGYEMRCGTNNLSETKFGIKIHPYKSTTSWQSINYKVNFTPGPNIIPDNKCGKGQELSGVGYYYVNDSFNITAKPEKDEVAMQIKKDEQGYAVIGENGNIVMEGKGKLLIAATDKNNQPISPDITIKSDNDKAKVVSQKEISKGNFEAEVLSTAAGTINFAVNGIYNNTCASASADIKFTSTNLNVKVDSKNPEAVNPDDPNSKANWGPPVDDYLQIPVSTKATQDNPERKYWVKAVIALKEGDKALSDKNVDIKFIDDKGVDITNDLKKIIIEGKNQTTDSNGEIVLKLMSPEQEKNADNTTPVIKGKIQASYTDTENGNKIDATYKYIDEAGREQDQEVGVEFGEEKTGRINLDKQCITTSKEAKDIWQEIATGIGMAKNDMNDNRSWFVKLINKAKNQLISILNISKARSENTGEAEDPDQKCNTGLDILDENSNVIENPSDTDMTGELDVNNDVVTGPEKNLSIIAPNMIYSNETSYNVPVKKSQDMTIKNDIYWEISNWDQNVKINKDALQKEADKYSAKPAIVEDGGKLIVTIDISDYMQKQTSNIASIKLGAELEMLAGFNKDDIEITYQVRKTEIAKSSKSSLFDVAHAQGKTTKLAEGKQKLTNRNFKNEPITLEKIIRKKKIKKDDKEVEESVIITEDNKEEFEQTLPDDILLYKVNFTSEKDKNLADVMFRVNEQAEDWGRWEKTDQPKDIPPIFNYQNEKFSKDGYYYDSKTHIIGQTKNSKKDETGESNFYIQLKKQIPFYTTVNGKEVKLNTIDVWAGIGRDKNTYINQSKEEKEKNTLKRDLWNEVEGEITGPYDQLSKQLNNKGQPIPGVIVSLYNNIDKLIIGRDVEKTNVYEKKIITTDDKGKINIRFDRNWFEKDDNFKVKVSFNNAYDLGAGKDKQLFPIVARYGHLSPAGDPVLDDIIYFASKVNFKDLKYYEEDDKKSKINYNLRLAQKVKQSGGNYTEDKDAPDWEFPIDVKKQALLKSIATEYSNLYNARRVLKEKNIFDTSAEMIGLSALDLPEETGGFTDMDNDVIYINEKSLIQLDARGNWLLPEVKNPESIYHELIHVIQKLINFGMPNIGDICRYSHSQIPRGTTPSTTPPLLSLGDCKDNGVDGISLNHGGYGNDTTYDSVVHEAPATFMSVYLRNVLDAEISSSKSWDANLYAYNSISQEASLNEIHPIFNEAYFKINPVTFKIGKTNTFSVDKKSVYKHSSPENIQKEIDSIIAGTGSSSEKIQKIDDKLKEKMAPGYIPEETLIANLFNYVFGSISETGMIKTGNFEWLKCKGFFSKSYNIPPPNRTMDQITDLVKMYFDILKTDRPILLSELYTSLRGKILNDNILKMDNLTTDRLMQYFLLFGVFEDQNSNWCYDPDKDKAIFSGNSEQFYIDLAEINTGAINKISPLLDPRINRPVTYHYPTYIKYNFVDKDNNPIEYGKIKIIIRSEPDEDGVRTENRYESRVRSGERIYSPPPTNSMPSTIYITAEGSKDYQTIDELEYYQIIKSSIAYDYFIEKTFKVDGNQSPSVDEINGIEENDENIPVIITPIDEGGGSQNDARGGETITVAATGFTNSEKVDVTVNNKNIGSAPIVAEKFGLKIDIPENIPLGKAEIKLKSDSGKEAAAKINITSNNWFNKSTIILAIIFLVVLAVIILLFYIIKNRLIYFPRKPGLTP